jgi:hypothetical protein
MIKNLPAFFLAGMFSAPAPAARAAEVWSSTVPARADTQRVYAMASDVLQALHSCHWALQVDVDARKPLVPLVLALNEQSQRLGQARSLLLKHQEEPLSEARQAVAGLLSGVELVSLAVAADLADINVMNDRWELAQKLAARTPDRRQAEDVLAAGASLLPLAFHEEIEETVKRRVRRFMRPRLSREDFISLLHQTDLLFGMDLEDARRDHRNLEGFPLMEAVGRLRELLSEGVSGKPPPFRERKKTQNSP